MQTFGRDRRRSRSRSAHAPFGTLSRLLKPPGRRHDGGIAMLTAAERHELIAKLRHLPTAVEAAVNDLSAAQLATPYREGGWTVGQVVHHLADSHLHGFV